MSRGVRWTRQIVGHAPAILIGFLLVIADRPVLAVAWFVLSRLCYVGFVGASLVLETRRGALSRRDGPEAAWRRFGVRAAWLMDNDAVAFAALCVVTAGSLGTPESFATTTVLGLALVALGVWVKVWATSSLTDGSYHWRDFFVTPPRSEYSATGPYRFISNPMYTVGYAHAYGVALVFRSVPGLAAAAFAQATILALLVFVERPHFARLNARSREAATPESPADAPVQRESEPVGRARSQ